MKALARALTPSSPLPLPPQTVLLESFQRSLPGTFTIFHLRGHEADRLQPWRAFQQARWFNDAIASYLDTLPDARRRQETLLLQDALPSLALEEEEGDDERSDTLSGGSSYSSAHASYLNRDEQENVMCARNVKLIIELVISVLAAKLRADPHHVIFIEDAHFLDTLSWNLMMEIQKGVRPCFIVLAYRPSFSTAARALELRAAAGAHIMPLGPLSEDEVKELLRRNLGDAPERDFRQRVAVARGHPLVVSELVRLLRHRRRGDGGRGEPLDSAGPAGVSLASRRGSGLDCGGSDALGGAGLLGHVLRSRLDSTSMNARLACKTAAVCGDSGSFTLGLVARVCPELTASEVRLASGSPDI